MSDTQILNRWRLILGRQALKSAPFGEGEVLENGISCFDLEDALDFLYSREYGEDVRREGGTQASRLTAATWITRIRRLVSQGNSGNFGETCPGALSADGAFDGSGGAGKAGAQPGAFKNHPAAEASDERRGAGYRPPHCEKGGGRRLPVSLSRICAVLCWAAWTETAKAP